EGTGLFDYGQSLLPFPVPTGTRVINVKVAFAPDGTTGYLGVLSNNGENDVAEGSYYPLLFKTTDGGENWDGPYNVQLGGPDGISCILNYLTDEFLEYIYEPPIPDRTELNFTTAFDFDIAVDAWGNPHLFFVVGLRGSDDWTIATGWEGLPGTGNSIALTHLVSYDDMFSWTGDTLNTPYTFRGTFTGTDDLDEDVRPYISVTPDGTKMFFSWINTTIAEENTAPDIYCVGHDIANHSYSQVFNVTSFTAVMWQAYMGTASYYVFDYGDNYEIPFACQLMNPSNNSDPVSFRYVDNFVLNVADLGFYVSEPEIDGNTLSVSQNYPNPVNGIAYFNVTLEKPAEINVEIINIIGQNVREYGYGQFSTGMHKLALDANGLESGIYFYTVTAGKQSITRKMIVE
ncbi:MAG: T9SS type A sorting domain-containing protein, partial [Bacteroidetes bacterium]|nr:T9SS type A sorting domain-containing protein [Bacteroidota bacterium]